MQPVCQHCRRPGNIRRSGCRRRPLLITGLPLASQARSRSGHWRRSGAVGVQRQQQDRRSPAAKWPSGGTAVRRSRCRNFGLRAAPRGRGQCGRRRQRSSSRASLANRVSSGSRTCSSGRTCRPAARRCGAAGGRWWLLRCRGQTKRIERRQVERRATACRLRLDAIRRAAPAGRGRGRPRGARLVAPGLGAWTAPWRRCSPG